MIKMSKIAFVNSSKSTESDHSFNTLISFRSYEEYLKLKDMDKQKLSELMKAHNRERIENFLVKKAISSDNFSKKLGKLLQDGLNNE